MGVLAHLLLLYPCSCNGKFGFIAPNTYLMGTNTPRLRNILLNTGRVEQIVDLPQGIWQDVNVDCVLLFLAREADEDKRRAQQVQIHMLGLRDTLDKLTERTWTDIITLLNEIKQIDKEIDERVLDLYGIIESADRQRVLGSAPVEEEEVGSEDIN